MIRVLVVEDDVHMRRVLTTVLENEGFEVLAAADGLEGIAAVETHDPACILTDSMMPRMGGLDMLAELKARGLSRPTIIVSAIHELPPPQQLKDLAVSTVVSKPFAFDQLIETVVKLVGR